MNVHKVVVNLDVSVNMKIIYKYPITSSQMPVSVCTMRVPENNVPLCIQIQNNQICLWTLVDTEEPLVLREFLIMGTGHLMPKDGVMYLGTVQQPPFVWHIFERKI